MNANIEKYLVPPMSDYVWALGLFILLVILIALILSKFARNKEDN
jgi:hypothetical protein